MRCNVGVDPVLLTDQWLIAEYRECPMLIGSLRYWDWEIKSVVPREFNLGAGHMNFLKIRLKYVQRRHEIVKDEMRIRGFYCGSLTMDLTGIPDCFCNDWIPSLEDSMKLRQRLIDKLWNKKENFWRIRRRPMSSQDVTELTSVLSHAELFRV